MWTINKNPQDYSRHFAECWASDLEAMLLRDRNHPSIIMWSIGNEIPKTDIKGGVELTRQIIAKVRSLDPTRPVTEGIPSFLIHGGWEKSANYFAELDVCGYNYMNRRYVEDHNAYPQRIIYGSETYPRDMFTEWKMAKDYPWMIGDFTWTAIDYIGEVQLGETKYVDTIDSRNMQARDGVPDGTDLRMLYDMMEKYAVPHYPSYQSNCGDLDIIGQKRSQGLYRDVLWDRSPLEIVIHEPIPDGKLEQIALWGWPREYALWNWAGHEGDSLQVRIFSKCDNVELWLNDIKIGNSASTEETQFISSFRVPYVPGQLSAKAFRNGVLVASKTLTTTGPTDSFRIIHENSDRPDAELSYLRVEAIDKDGRLVPTDTSEIEIALDGNCHLEASGNSDTDGINDVNKHCLRLHNGQAQLVIKHDSKATNCRISVNSISVNSQVSLEI